VTIAAATIHARRPRRLSSETFRVNALTVSLHPVFSAGERKRTSTRPR
jgi:hypothetical protein